MKLGNTSRSASEKLEFQFPIFYVACTTRGGHVPEAKIETAGRSEMVRQLSYTSELPVGPGPCQMR